MKARTTVRVSQTYSRKRRKENAAPDETVASSEPATNVTANGLVNTTIMHKSECRRESDVALLTLDTIARGSLPAHSFVRYLAYKRALLSSDQDIQSISYTLILFIQGLYLGRADTTLH